MILAQTSRQPDRWERRTALPHRGHTNMRAFVLILAVLEVMATAM
jgi:hypothetical protein